MVLPLNLTSLFISEGVWQEVKYRLHTVIGIKKVSLGDFIGKGG